MDGRSHWRRRWTSYGNFENQKNAGYTLMETIVVLAISSLLMGITIPSLSHILSLRLLNNAQDQILQTMRQAQQKSQHQRVNYQASFREINGIIQTSAHPSTALPTEIVWTDLPKGVRIDVEATTLRRNRQGTYFIQFSYRGNVNGQLGRMTVHRPNQTMPKRCVFASTLIGTLRRDINRNCARR